MAETALLLFKIVVDEHGAPLLEVCARRRDMRATTCEP
jgi:hypothetical protein